MSSSSVTTPSGVLIDLERRVVRAADGRKTALTQLEVALLQRLWAAQGAPVSQAVLLEEVWGYAPGVQSRAVDKTVTRLRSKLGTDRDLLESVAREGYRFTQPVAAALPFEVPVIVGRERELDDIEAALGADSPIVTLLGPGGMGKTTIAKATAARHLPMAWHAVAPGETPEGVLGGLATSIGATQTAGRTGSATIALAARHQRLRLAVVDNAEVALSAVKEACADLLRQDFEPKILVTSRSRLGLPGERVLEVGPLDGAAAASLFRRAMGQHVVGARVATDDLRPVIEAMEGIPLALEMAAAWTRVLSLAQIAERFGPHPLDLHVPGEPTRLRTVLERSWNLLRPVERAGLGQLAVFRDGFDVASAEQVVTAPDVASLVLALRDRSFLHPVEPDRFALYDSLRDLALELQGEEAAGARERHARWATDLASRSWRPPDEWGDLDTALHRETRNLRAALEHTGDPDAAALLGAALGMVLAQAGRHGEALRLLRPADASVDPLARWRTLLTLARVAWVAGRPPADTIPMLEDALSLSRGLGPSEIVTSLTCLARIRYRLNQLGPTQALLDEALPHLGQVGPAIEAPYLEVRASLTETQQVGTPALELLARAAKLAEEGGLRSLRVHIEMRQARGLSATSRERGRAAYDELVRVVREGPPLARQDRGRALWGLGALAVEVGLPAEGESLMREAASVFLRSGDELGSWHVQSNLWVPLALQGDLEGAASSLEAAVSWWERTEARRAHQSSLQSGVRVALGLGERDRARKALEQSEALGSAPNDAAVHARLRATLAALEGDVAGARLTVQPESAAFAFRFAAVLVDVAEAVAAGTDRVPSLEAILEEELTGSHAVEFALLERAFRARNPAAE